MPAHVFADLRYSRPLAGLRGADEPAYGGKSAGLGELLAAGIPVPDGFALSTTAFRAFLGEADLTSEIDRLLATAAGADLETIGSVCGVIVEAIGSASVPAAVQAEIAHGYAALARASGESAPPVAVRSSAIGEDSHSATFAGQQETFLWVRGADRVIDAVRDCWASLYSPTAVSYRSERAAALGAPAMGVTVQLMVDALISGVMFTCNPVSGDPSIVAVNASWGLGEAVVAGEVTPDEYLLSRITGELVRERVGDKHVEHVPARAGGGTVRRAVAAERRAVACLSDGDLRALVDLARRVQRHFASPQDIEWAIARAGAPPPSLSVLQCRPVTALPRPQPKPRPQSAISLVMRTFGADRASSAGA
ncbi:MAG: PEP/pyruvate-binding domain-containing protein [Solirubrobacteraceae bacterium]